MHAHDYDKQLFKCLIILITWHLASLLEFRLMT